MRAVYITKFGGTENLEFRDVPDPAEPHGSQVLVRVRAAGVNRADLLQVRGNYPPPAGCSPNIPGLEFAGEVAAVGDKVTGLTPGDRVCGITAGAGQAEMLLGDASLLIRIPRDLNFREAAAIPEAFITAHDAIFTRGELRSGQTLLIHAVGSGVGLAGLQMAKGIGATVIGTSRTREKLDRCREFGLDAAIETGGAVDFAAAVREHTSGRGVDVILDLVGGAYLTENLNSLAAQGRLILVGLTSGRTAEVDLGLVLRTRATIVGTVLRPRSVAEKAEATRAFADAVLPLLACGEVRPNLDRVFPASEATAAYDYLSSNKSFGKVVLEF